MQTREKRQILILDPLSQNPLAALYQISEQNELLFSSKIRLFKSSEDFGSSKNSRKDVASLVNQVESLFQREQKELLDLERIIFCSGPGPFSVLRNTCVFLKTLKFFKPEIKIFKLNLLEIALFTLEPEQRKKTETLILPSRMGFFKAVLTDTKKLKFTLEEKEEREEKEEKEIKKLEENPKTWVLREKFYEEGHFVLTDFLFQLNQTGKLNCFLLEQIEEILPDYGKEAL